MKTVELPPIVVNTQGFIVFFQMEDNKIHSVVCNLMVGLRAPIPELPFATALKIPFAAKELGHPSDEEIARLTAMNDAFQAQVNKPPSIIKRLFGSAQPPVKLEFVGQITGAGTRSFYYYSDRKIDKSCFIALQSQFKKNAFSAGSFNDENWELYLNAIHPGTALHPLLASVAQREMRTKNGDNLEKVRPVDHTLYFPDQAARQKFLDMVKDDKFNVKTFEVEENAPPEAAVGVLERGGIGTTSARGEAKKTLRYGLILTKSHKIDQISTDILIVGMNSWANSFGGEYDGWGAPHVTDK